MPHVYTAIIYDDIISNNAQSHANSETLATNIYRASLNMLNETGSVCSFKIGSSSVNSESECSDWLILN